jgi:uncharacterized coiled-coil protein SlyX
VSERTPAQGKPAVEEVKPAVEVDAKPSKATAKANEEKTRVFQCVDPDNTPTQIVTFMQESYVDRDGMRHGAKTVVIDRNQAGQFVLRRGATEYLAQLAALRRVCEDKPHFLQEVSEDRLNVVPQSWGTSAENGVLETKRKEAENSELITQLKRANVEQSEEMAQKDAQIDALTKRLEALESKNK